MIKTYNWNVLNEDYDTTKSLVDNILLGRNMSMDSIFSASEHSPFSMAGMEKVVDKIIEAIQTNLKIMITGDYDCDGLCSTVSICSFLKKISANCDYIVPDRLLDGYGLSFKMADYIIDNGYKLVITVDNGIACHEVIDYLQFSGVTVIVTDHHEQKETLPNTEFIINPKMNDSKYPFKELAGAGVVLKLIQAICDKLNYPSSFYEENYIYAMLGTISDVMSVLDENKIIIQKGLNIAKKLNIPFFNALCTISKKELNTVTSTDIAFSITPKINAAGRLGNLDLIFNLLFSKDLQSANKFATDLDILNNQRKEMVDNMMAVATTKINNSLIDLNNSTPIIVSQKGWHKGVLGIVAARLSTLYNRPAFVFTEDEKGVCVGSCRSYNDINILAMIEYAEDTLIAFGGHKEAAGLSIKKENMKMFYDSVSKYCKTYIDVNMYMPILNADLITTVSEMTIDNAEDILSLEPFGSKNNKPKFMLSQVIVNSFTVMGKTKEHIKLELLQDNNKITAIGFYKSDFVPLLYKGMKIDVLCNLDINIWNDKKTPQLIIEDIHISNYTDCDISIDEELMYQDKLIEIEDLVEECEIPVEKLVPVKEEYLSVFKLIVTLLQKNKSQYFVTDLNMLTSYVMTLSDFELNIFKLMRILESLNEAQYLIVKQLTSGVVVISSNLRQNKKPSQISKTESYLRCHISKKESED